MKGRCEIRKASLAWRGVGYRCVGGALDMAAFGRGGCAGRSVIGRLSPQRTPVQRVSDADQWMRSRPSVLLYSYCAEPTHTVCFCIDFSALSAR
jgi:hypothetical protein